MSRQDDITSIIAMHETFFSGLAQQNPHNQQIRQFMITEWTPWFSRWLEITADGGPLADQNISQVARSLSDLRGRASQRGVPIPDLSGFHATASAPSAPAQASQAPAQQAPQASADPWIDAQLAHAQSIDDARTLASQLTSRTPAQGSGPVATMSYPTDPTVGQIDAETDRRFWQQTGYKPGQKLNPSDPNDRQMVPTWVSIRYQVAKETAQAADPTQPALQNAGGGTQVGRGGGWHGGGGGGRGGWGGRRGRFGGGGGGWWPGWGWWGPYPYYDDVVVVTSEQPEDDQAQEAAVSGACRGLRFGPRLTELSATMDASSPVGSITIQEFSIDGDALSARVCIDDKCYAGTADISSLLAAVGERFSAYHHDLHEAERRAGHALVGRMVDAVDRKKAALCAGWWDDLTKTVSSAFGSISHTLSQYKGPIANAAGQAAGALATKAGAPDIAPMASSLAQNLVTSAAGGGGTKAVAQTLIDQAKAVAQQNPDVAKALDLAHQAATKATLGYHLAQTSANAAAGNPDAIQQLADLGDQAGAGDPGAQASMDVASSLANSAAPAGQGGDDATSVTGWNPYVPTISAGWFDDLTKSVKNAVNDVVKTTSHYALHPSDIVRDVSKKLGAGKDLANALSYVANPLQAVQENPAVQQAAAGYFGGPAGVAGLKAAQTAEAGKFNVNDIGSTIKAFAPQIAQAAQSAAGKIGGPNASSIAGALVSAAAGNQGTAALAKQFVNQAEAIASQNPQAAAALDAAHHAVAQATAGIHAAQTQNLAAQGDTAAKELAALMQADTGSASDSSSSSDSSSDATASSGAPDVRQTAQAMVASSPGMVIGFVKPKDNPPQVHVFNSTDDADDWYGSWVNLPHAYEYVAYYNKRDQTYPGPLNESIGGSGVVSSGWLSALLFSLGGFAAGYYGPRGYQYARSKWAAYQAAHQHPSTQPAAVQGALPWLIGIPAAWFAYNMATHGPL